LAGGDIFVISAPSGAGKTTLIRSLMAGIERLHFSVSHTTRRKRREETPGADYHFVDRPKFDEMIAADLFLEWAEVHGERYGTSRPEVEKALARGEDVLLDLDTQGAASIRGARPEAVLVFILPPSVKSLEERLVSRGAGDPEELRKRREAAGKEIAALDMYDYTIVNDSLDRAVEDLRSIIRARRLRRTRMSDQVSGIVTGFESEDIQSASRRR
jgi:guanylate kinase